MRNVSVPWGQADPEHPNLAPTYWRTVADQKNMRYYFESALSPNVIWVSLADIDFSPHSGIRSLKIEEEDLIGNVTKPLKPTEIIRFLAPD